MTDNGKGTLYSKLAAVMGELTRLPKQGHNAYFNYDFVTDTTIMEAVREKLAAHNVAFLPSMVDFSQVEVTNTKGKTELHTVVTFDFTFACGDTGETVTTKWVNEALDGADKGFNKTATAAAKYFLMKTFLISSGDLDDETDHSESGVTKQNKPVSRQTQAPVTTSEQPAQPKGNQRGQSPYTANKPVSQTAAWELNDASEGVLIMQVKNALPNEAPPHVVNAVKKMRADGEFAACATFADAVALAVAHFNKPNMDVTF